MSAYDQGASLSLLAGIVGGQGWQLVPTQWHRVGQRAANTPVRGVTGSAAFHSAAEMVAWTSDLQLHLEGGPDCTGRFAKPAVRPPLFVTGLDVDHGYAGKGGGDTLVEMEMMLGPLPASWSTTARGQWSPSRRRWYRHPADLVILDAAFTEHGGHIETIRTGHRYSWIAPAIHTRKGQVVGPVVWYGPDQEPTDIPHVGDLPEFPSAWLDYFRVKAAEKAETAIAVAQGGEPGAGRPITSDHADNVVGVLTRRLHEMPPSGGEFRNTVFGLAAVLARREVARGGTTQNVMNEMLAIFATHPMGLGMDADDVHWTEDGIAEGWSTPWRFVDPAVVIYRKPTPAEFMAGVTPVEYREPVEVGPSGATKEEFDYFLRTYTRFSSPQRLGRRAAWAKTESPDRLPWHAQCLVGDVLAGHYPAERALVALADAYRHHGGRSMAAPRQLLSAALGVVLDKKVSA